MKRIVLLFALAPAFVACQFSGFNRIVGNGVSVETTPDVGAFEAISLSTSMDVVFTQAPEPQPPTFVCDENLLEYYDIKVDDGTLKIDVKPGTWNLAPRVKTVLTVQSPVLNTVKVSGSGEVDIDGGVTADGYFSLQVSGSGDISVDGPVTCGDFTVSVSGSGDISVDGPVSCGDFFASTSGSGSIDVEDVSATSARFRTSGSGDIRVNGTLTCEISTVTTIGSGGIGIAVLTADEIQASASGSGSIRLTGLFAGDITASTTGSGDIRLEGSARSLSSSSSGSGRVDAARLTLLRN